MIKICDFCGKIYKKDLSADAYLGNNCFDCSFWLKKTILSDEDEARRVIAEGEHYMIALETNCMFKGFGGRQFRIRFFDGREIETSNLWHQGNIPAGFRALLPDNADLVRVEMAASTVIDTEIPF